MAGAGAVWMERLNNDGRLGSLLGREHREDTSEEGVRENEGY